MHFKQIKHVQILSENLEQFLHAGIEWTNSLNNDLNIKNEIEFKNSHHRIITIELVERESDLKRPYTYPDSDFCIYKDFPHSQLIAPIIILAKREIECSCTLIWIHQYWKRYFKSNLDYKDDFYPFYSFQNDTISTKEICLKGNTFKNLNQSCNFEQKFNSCKGKISTRKEVSLQGNMNLFFVFKWLQYIIEVFLRPILCFIGLITNFLTLKVIQNKEHVKNFKSPMYKHIQFNALFNICFCFIYSFSLMNICIFPKSSFCSSVLKDEASQYLKIYLIYFLGNTFRLCCNFSYISFITSRLISTVATTKSRCKKTNEKLNVKLFYLITFLMSLILSIFKIFENRPNEVYSNFDKNFPYNAYDVRYCSLDEYKPTNCNIFWALNLINNFLNNISFLILSLIIDLFLLRYSFKVIKEKRTLHCPHLKDAKELKAKLNKMVITNGILFFISHIPESIVTILLLIFKTNLLDFCFYFFSCFELIEMAQTFHFISIGFQFFIFLKFDCNFKQSFYSRFFLNVIGKSFT